MTECWHRRGLAAALILVALGACGDTGGASDADAAGPTTDGYPAPRDDLVPRVGMDNAVDIATWNVENFPQLSTTPRFLADLITSVELDLVAVEEIANVDAFNELVARLPNHSGLLSTHTYSSGEYQKVGFIYRHDYISVDSPTLLFQGDTYAFPRPPLQVNVGINTPSGPVQFVAIVVHLKAGVGTDDRDRRVAAITALEGYVRDLVAAGQTDVLLLGDFNEQLNTTAGMPVFEPFSSDPTDYRMRTQQLAAVGGVSFLPSAVMLDHVISTAGLDVDFSDNKAQISRLDRQFNAYQTAISDHLPVIVSMPILE